MNMVKRDNWFKEYQEIPGMKEGKRKLADRIDGFDPGDFAGKSVLDLGCNIGQMSLYAAEQGASAVLGVEYDTEAFREAMEVRDRKNLDTLRYKLDDLDNPLFWHHIERHDTVLLLSVIDTKELENRFGILGKACMKCKGVLYLEGHGRQPRSRYFQYILDNTDFTQIEHIGSYEGRDLFRCSRDILDTEGFYRKVHDVCERYDKICILGNQKVGKSTLCGSLQVHGCADFTVLDDCNVWEKHKDQKLVLFDYRAALYASDWDVVFNVLQPPRKFEVKRKNARYLRSSQIEPSETLCNLYTVRTH